MQASCLFDEKFCKLAYSIFLILRQTDEFKNVIAKSYWANYNKLSDDKKVGFFVKNLGCQVLSVAEVAVKVFEDPVLVEIISLDVTSIFGGLIEYPEIKLNYDKVVMLLSDLKYMAKPLVLPKIVSNTHFLDLLIRSLSTFQFADMFDMPLEMEPYPTFHKFFNIYTADYQMIETF